jgi:hypothetical protein
MSETAGKMTCGDVIHVSKVGAEACECGRHHRKPPTPSADRERAAFMAGFTAVYAWREEGSGKGWAFEEESLHQSAKEAAYAAWLATQPKETP